MSPVSKKIQSLIVFLLVAVGVTCYFFYNNTQKPAPVAVVETVPIVHTTTTSRVIGHSVDGREIVAHIYGNGPKHLIFVGGIHGGYEWNSVLLANTFVEYLNSHIESIPKNLTISVIPSMNPDAIYKVTNKEGTFTANDVSTNETLLKEARFNSHAVDLNRNFDCNWQSKSTWQSKTVSAGTSVLSEPEAQAISTFILDDHPTAVVFWHSKSNAVYASQCNNGISPATTELMNIYANASGYQAVPSFDAYKVTGAVEDWLASMSIPAITVELKTHEEIEWDKNLAGSLALIKHYSQ